MNLSFPEFLVEEKELLADFIVSETWEYYEGDGANREQVFKNVEEGYYTGIGNKSFWIKDSDEIIGFIRLFFLGKDINDKETPLLDIRIKNSRRSKGIGFEAVRWLTEYIFMTFPNKWRIEAFTRIDNIAMRKVFEKCGYVKEAQFRKSWRTKEGEKLDSIGYGILKSDWQNKTKTPVEWEK